MKPLGCRLGTNSRREPVRAGTLGREAEGCARRQVRLITGILACNLLHKLHRFYLMGEEFKRAVEWLIKGLIKVGAKVAVSRSEVAGSCRVGVSFGPTISSCVQGRSHQEHIAGLGGKR